MGFLKSPLGFLILVIMIVVFVFGLVNWQKTGQFFGISAYKNVDLVALLSFANLYSGKKICTEGFYVQTPGVSILKVSLSEDEFTRSAWINNPTEKEIILQSPYAPEKSVQAKICGFFQSSRGGEFGNPPVWNHQLTVEKFEILDQPQPLNKF
jgi:hypothetical protein